MSGLTTNLLRSCPGLRVAAARMMSSDAPQRFGTAKGHSGWTWDNNGIGMGGNDTMFRYTYRQDSRPVILGKDAGPGTEAKEGLGKDKEYPNPEFFKYNNYSYFDIEKQVVDSNKRVEQPKSGLTEFW